MKTTKEYPATHSMSTAWYIVDDEGNVGILDYNENQPENKSKGGRVTIPTTIRAVLRLKRNDYFRVERNPEGTHFVLKIATDELTLEDLEGITDEQSEE